MKLKNIVLAAALATGLGPAFAADQVVDLSVSGSFIGTAPLLSGGDDVVTFSNLAAGTYNLLLSISAQNITGLTATLNGVSASIFNNGVFSFGSLDSVGTSPFVLTLTGASNALSKYSGELTVTAVPEPETYALLLAGLGVVGFVARRRRPQ